MKILYAIQGTGNGHIARALEIYPLLTQYGDIDVLISGIQADLDFPYPVKYQLYGLSFIFGRHGGVDMWETFKKLRPLALLKDISTLPVRSYDLVINDFEPVSAWACKVRKVPCIALSHQAAVLHPNAPVPDATDKMGRMILRHYAPASVVYSFHFKSFADNMFTPVIRKGVRNIQPEDQGHYTVYLPAYDDITLVQHLSQISSTTRWQVFSKHNRITFTQGNVWVQPVTGEAFLNSMATARGVLCGAGFETPAEALYLGKKLLVIPMHHQYEQQCNAATLSEIGVPVIRHLGPEYYEDIRKWLNTGNPVPVHYKNDTAAIIELILQQIRRWNPAQLAH